MQNPCPCIFLETVKYLKEVKNVMKRTNKQYELYKLRRRKTIFQCFKILD